MLGEFLNYIYFALFKNSDAKKRIVLFFFRRLVLTKLLVYKAIIITKHNFKTNYQTHEKKIFTYFFRGVSLCILFDGTAKGNYW